MRRLKCRLHTVVDMYKEWCNEKLKANPSYTHGYDHATRRTGVRIIYDSTGKVVMNYTLFRTTIERYNRAAGEMVIEGRKLRLGKNLGYLIAARQEISYGGKLKVRFHATKEARKLDPTHPTIYFTSDELVKICWLKPKRIVNETVYYFAVACDEFKEDGTPKGLKQRFSLANKVNPALRANYKYIPLR